MMSSLSAIVPGSRLRMRSLQLCLNTAGHLLLDDHLVSRDNACLRDLRWWSDESHLLVGLSLGDYLPDLCLFSDASDQGWRAALGDFHLSGLWSPLCSSFSINQRELLAILFAIRGFLPHLRGQTVAVYSDSSGLSPETGRHPFVISERSGSGTSSPLRGSVGSFSAAVHSRSSQCPGGFPNPSLSSPRFGVDVMSSGLRGNPSILACHNRPLRDGNDTSPSGVLLANVRPDVCGHRCDVTVLGRSTGVCLSSVRTPSSSVGEGSGVQESGADVSGSVLASAPVVPGPSGASAGGSSFPAKKEGSSQTTPFPSIPPTTVHATVDCVSYIRRSTRQAGFSHAVAGQLACC